MALRPSESLKERARELAQLILSGSMDNERKAFLSDQLSSKVRLTDKNLQDEKPSAPPPGDAIGIWTRVMVDGKAVYRRDHRKIIKWLLWADVREIPARHDKKRIILLGESAARGYFYNPHYTVAKELEAVLNNTAGSPDFEVIDLARTGEKLEGLFELVASCKGMEPDLVVIFAGNNWQEACSRDDSRRLYEIFKNGSMDKVQTFLEDRMAHCVTGFLNEVQEKLVRSGIPVVFIIPDFNLKDWKSDETEKSLSWLPDGRRDIWLQAREAAQFAISNNDPEAWETAARLMVDIDLSNPCSQELLGQFYASRQQWGEARKCLERARDAGLIGNSTVNPPRCLKIIRDTILSQADAAGIKVVDLPTHFDSVLPTGLPDRTIFLDYCHLTITGIKIAMKCAAQVILGMTQGRHLPMEAIKESNIMPGRLVQAIAHFSAAIHNAHYAQPSDIIRHHCRMAIALDPVIKDTMRRYMDFSVRRTSTSLCRTFEEIIAEETMRQYDGGLGLRHPANGKLMDLALNDILAEVLSDTGSFDKDRLTALRIKEHGITEEKTDLLRSFYGENTYNNFKIKPQPGYVQARSTSTSFYFVSANETASFFHVVYRTPGRYDPERFVRIYLNDDDDATAVLPMSESWASCTLEIDKESLLKGANKLRIEWPYTFIQLDRGNMFFTNYYLQATFPVLGEIFSLTAVTGSIEKTEGFIPSGSPLVREIS